ncbi:MAG: OmpA family protein [Candidatus Latescibacteria bacterium]|nr:OmpA family protein [Candidatus Latescibacterota bacterium]
MKKISRFIWITVYLSVLSTGTVIAREPDVEGSKDHPLLTRLPNFYIVEYEEHEFDTHTFYVGNTETPVEGHYFYIFYTLQPDAKEPSITQILRNYENAITKIGGKVLASNFEGNSCMKVEKDGKEIWVHVYSDTETQYLLYIIEKEAMTQQVTANAEVFSNDLKATGHTAVYGIYFDSGKSEIKPESEAALVEIAKLLKAEPSLKVYVVGHTDNVGSMDSNMKLSQARAEAVVQSLVSKQGIEAGRLKSYGVSSLVPVASNDSEDGKAKNRRVELVKQ